MGQSRMSKFQVRHKFHVTSCYNKKIEHLLYSNKPVLVQIQQQERKTKKQHRGKYFKVNKKNIKTR